MTLFLILFIFEVSAVYHANHVICHMCVITVNCPFLWSLQNFSCSFIHYSVRARVIFFSSRWEFGQILIILSRITIFSIRSCFREPVWGSSERNHTGRCVVCCVILKDPEFLLFQRKCTKCNTTWLHLEMVHNRTRNYVGVDLTANYLIASPDQIVVLCFCYYRSPNKQLVASFRIK
jgi:hypothetical protein